MNELKNPTALLAGTNIVFSVGGFMFLYKRMEQLQNENTELKKNLQALTANVLKNSNDNEQINELMGKMYKDVKNLKDDIPDDLRAIMDTLEDHDINVTLPKKKSKKKKYSSEESSEESPKRKYKKKTKDEIENEDIINMMRLRQKTY